MRIKNCPTQEIGATFFKKSTDRHAKNLDGTRQLIEYEVKACKMFDAGLGINGFVRNHEYYPCEEKFATTTFHWKRNTPKFVENNFCRNCISLARHSYIQPWADHLSAVKYRETEYAEEQYIWFNYVLPSGKYMGEKKRNYWE
jgi:hypothetical protein